MTSFQLGTFLTVGEAEVAVGCPPVRPRRKRLSGFIQEIQANAAIQRQTVHRPPVLREDAQVVVQVILPPLDRCLNKQCAGVPFVVVYQIPPVESLLSLRWK